MNPFLRDEPPMLGAPITPTNARANPKVGGSGTTATRTPAPTSDPYTQNLGRTPPRPATPSTAGRDPSATDAEAAPANLPQPTEDGVHTTALDATSSTSNSSGIILKPPVALTSSPDSTRTTPSNPPGTSEPSPTPPGAREVVPAATVETVVADARKRLDALACYQVEINRQERVGDQLQEAEDVVLSIRRDPRAVRLEWRKGPHQGREVIYSVKETQGMMRINMADASLPIPRLTLPPDSPLILRTSRHPITEAGFDTILGNLERTLGENKAGDQSHGRISYDGPEQPAPLDHPCHKIVRVTASGETWQIYLDPESRLPAMVQAQAANGDLLERYCFRNVLPDPPELASADAFDPDRRWGEPKGLLSRLAGAAAAAQAAEPATSR
jgi:hypothetical protein